jgi:hypothetical protein
VLCPDANLLSGIVSGWYWKLNRVLKGDFSLSTQLKKVVEVITQSADWRCELFFLFLFQVQDGVLLNGKLEEYQRAFSLVDTTGNGTLGASEIAQLFKNLGQPLSPTKLFRIMEEYDGDGTGEETDMQDPSAQMKVQFVCVSCPHPRSLYVFPGNGKDQRERQSETERICHPASRGWACKSIAYNWSAPLAPLLHSHRHWP